MQKTTKAKHFTRGGQITFHNLRMLFQINKVVGKVYLAALLFLTCGITYLITPQEIISAFYYWCYAQISPLLALLGYSPHSFYVPYQGGIYYATPKIFLAQSQFVREAHAIFHYFIISLISALFLSLGIVYFFIKWLIRQGKKQTGLHFLRGTKLAPAQQVAKQIKKTGQASSLTIDNFPLLVDSETQHFLFHGTTGAGKSQLIMKLLDYLRKRGEKVFLYDKGCVYTPLYYRADQDKILYPFDERCENWDLWQEALDAPDFENMAESLIPMHGESDPFWVNAARTIFASTAYTMQDDPDRSISKLLKLLLTSELEDLASYLAGTEAATLTSEKIEKTAISIRSVITSYLKPLRFLADLDKKSDKKTAKKNKPGFSIRDWLQDEKSGWLFLSSSEEHHASLKPLISMWFAIASITLLSLPENRQRRIWFICDELPSLHKLPQFPETIAEARKFGGCFALGMQSYAQLEKVYGRNASREIFDLLNTRFFFRSPSADMAKLVSQELGEQEIEDTRENYSYGANRIRDGISIGSQQMTKPIVVYPEIMELADLKCYLRLPADFPVTLLDLKLELRKKIEAGFIKRDLKKDEELENKIKLMEGKALEKTLAQKADTYTEAINQQTGNANDKKYKKPKQKSKQESEELEKELLC